MTTQTPEGDRPLAVSVIGTGYLGATHAACLASLGYDVVGVDADSRKVDSLAAGVAPFFEPGLDPLLRKGLDTGRLRFTTAIADVAGADVHFLCVGTPQAAGSRMADLSALHAAVAALLPHLRPGATIVGRSTVPAGTAVELGETLDAHLAGTGRPGSVELTWNPEFLREGRAVDDTLHPDRLVFGVRSARGEAVLRAVFAPLIASGTPVVVTDFATAELVKVAANSFLATKISFINAMAEVCEATGADVLTLARTLSMDTRIGGRFLQPGLGFGGGCLPKDIRAFVARARQLGAAPAVAFLEQMDAINQRRRARVVDLARELAGGDLHGVRVAALGAAFKPDSDDIRDSPALEVAARLTAEGASVTVADPAAVPNARLAYPQLAYAPGAMEALTGADLVILLTEWAEFARIDPQVAGRVVRQRRLLDTRHAYDPATWRAAGWCYRAPGRPPDAG